MARTSDAGKTPFMGPSSYVILGLLDLIGPATPYDLKRVVAGSVGYFWPFPQSQLYAEAERLAGLGLVEEAAEGSGRRRRVFRLTAAGRRQLQRWVKEPTDAQTELRDLGLLKLFFATAVDRRAVTALAEHQRTAHQRRLDEYRAIDAGFTDDDRSPPRRTLEMGLTFERAMVAFWTAVVSEPPDLKPTGRGPASLQGSVG